MSFLNRARLYQTDQRIGPVPLPIIHVLILAAFIVLAYYPSLDAPFIFDDFHNIVENPAVHPENFAELGNVVESPASANRPVALLTFSFNYLAGGLDVFGYHLVNILIHVANCLLIYIIIHLFPLSTATELNQDELTSRYTLAFWAAAFWALNPVQTQAVTYIVQRMTSLATLFYLGAIVVYLLWRKKILSPLTAILSITLCFVLGLASKEIVVTLPLALILLDIITRPQIITNKYKCILGAALLAAVLPGLYFLGHMPDWFAIYHGRNFSPWERVMTQWRIVWHYISLFIFPLPSRIHLAYDPVVSRSLFSPWTTIPSLLAIVMSCLVAWRIRKSSPLTSFGILFFFLALSVESTFANIELAFIHRLYLPSAFLIPATLCIVPPRILKRSGIVLIALLGLWAFWTVTRNDEWNRGEEFWAADLDRGASATRALNNKGAALNDAGSYTKAITLFREASNVATTEGEHRISLYNLGTALLLNNQTVEALATFRDIEKRYGPYLHSSLYIGEILIENNKIQEALSIIQELDERHEESYEARILEAVIMAKKNDFKGATQLLEQTIEKEPEALVGRQVQLRLDLARLYLKAGDAKKAYTTYQEVTKLFPQQYFAWTQIYRMLIAGGDNERAAVIKQFLQKKGVQP